MVNPNLPFRDRGKATGFPLVSVIVPAYNAERFIGRTLESVLTQTYQNFEVLVVDDGSHDHTAAIVRQYMARDGRIQLWQQPNSGVAAARNLAIAKSKGELIAPLDADDIWYPLNLEKQVECLVNSSPRVGLTYAWSIDIDAENQPTGAFRAAPIEGLVYPTLLLHDFIANASSVLIRRSCLHRVGNYNVQLRAQAGQGREDWDLYLRMAEQYEFRVVPDFLVGYRKLPDSMSRDYSSMARSNEIIWQAIREKYPNMPQILYRLSTSSFYMNLAHQSYSPEDPELALFWIKRAFQKDWLTPMLRTISYRALLSYWGQSFSPVPSLSALSQSGRSVGLQAEPWAPPLGYRGAGGRGVVAARPPQSSTLKTVAERLIHRVISSVFRNPVAWEAKPGDRRHLS
ncbi:glycosyltransferase family 2 protein [Leptolyngbya sp. KIOST-1]|uniref:glycosyltransferase family 2 protein n=1 Tax=Leptolyngbya sp. KIOST-1 TaxID=1229172 RepID=UPI00068F92DE|nr:glycosyltransferase family A protein [Leptolyngbya sp. KIOST-1]